AKWLTNMTAIGIGISLIAFGAGVWMVSRRRISGGALCFIVFGISMISNGLWPMGSPMHGLYAIGIINILAAPLVYMDVHGSVTLPKFHGVTVALSLIGVFYFWILLTGLDPDGYSGLTQRVFAAVAFLWVALFVRRWTRLPRDLAL
ncbi:MAG: DUF998 domain-containing protein, partial [Litorimonas sp.]